MQHRLLSMKNLELKDILQKCGWSVSGTKAAMVTRIQSQLPQSRLTTLKKSRSKPGTLEISEVQGDDHRILSLDMGIKNIALCLLKVSTQDLATRKSVMPEILAWRRFSLFDLHESDNQDCKNKQNVEEQLDIDFATAPLAPYATALARQLISVHRPTVIAIEKQRYRTMGSATVQEWTIRVNKLEAMLHAALRVLQEEGVWEHGITHSVCPQKTTGYWLCRYSPARGARSGKITKPLKVSLVKTWLKDKTHVQYAKKNALVTDTVSLFSKSSSQNKAKTGEKLDDLADCLLQGLAIVHWEKSRLELLTEFE